jgi:hypothetical protein
MQRVCPKCQQTFVNQMLCPNCGIQLITSNFGSAVDASSSKPVRLDLNQEHPAFWGRFFIGLLLAQGFYHSFRQILIGLLVSPEAIHEWSAQPTGILILSILQVTSLVIGSLVASAGQPYGAFLGLCLGAVNYGILSVIQFFSTKLFDVSTIYSELPLHLVFGLTGGVLGRILWKPLPALPRYQSRSSSVKIEEKEISAEIDRGPLFWSKILTGAVFAFVGTVWAHEIRAYLHRFGGRVASNSQDQFVIWEIGALIVLIGGIFAGSATRRGFMHGFCVGVVAMIGLVITQYSKGVRFFPSHEFWILQAGIDPRGGPIEFGAVFIGAMITLVVAVLGGVLGAQLFPPKTNRSS